ncbi:MAG: DUF2149 domain-containing protein [Oscillospiraceae bacterium]|jgi:hypothetical protein|nr:DUF2149 domain-containing protein [Oscillospiraceae bacterium]
MKSRFEGNSEAFAEGDDPMAGLSNLADVMLVLACGLMLALVINWNVDIAPKTDGGDNAAAEEIQEVEFGGDEGEALDADAELEELGAVYRDPATGKLYLVKNGDK